MPPRNACAKATAELLQRPTRCGAGFALLLKVGKTDRAYYQFAAHAATEAVAGRGIDRSSLRCASRPECERGARAMQQTHDALESAKSDRAADLNHCLAVEKRRKRRH